MRTGRAAKRLGVLNNHTRLSAARPGESAAAMTSSSSTPRATSGDVGNEPAGERERGQGVGKRPARILCLHGYENSAPILRKQLDMSGWLRELPDCEFVFANAPFSSELPVSPIVQQFFPDDPKCQWFEKIEHLDSGVRYRGLSRGLDHVAATLSDQGPFDGILGFSQGSALSLYTIAKQQHGELSVRGGHPPLQFAIIIAGFRPRDVDHHHLFGAPLTVPTLHIWGTHDVLKHKSEEVTKNCVSPVVMTHKAGHKVPNMKTLDVAKIRQFIQTNTH